MKTYNAKDFWEVAVSDGIFMETKRYVPKLIAAIIIARNPEKYGFTDVTYKKPAEYDLKHSVTKYEIYIHIKEDKSAKKLKTNWFDPEKIKKVNPSSLMTKILKKLNS